VPVPLVLFDLDNTLLDRVGAYRRWVQRFAADRGLEEEAAIAWFVDADRDGDASRAEVFGLVRSRFDLPDPVEDLVAAYRAEAPRYFRLDEEIARVLSALRREGWRIGIVTNGEAMQEEKIRRTGLDTLVDGWVVSGVDGIAKPAVRAFELAAERCGAVAAGGWFVGDHPVNDIVGALDAGMRAIWIRRDRVWDLEGCKPTTIAGSVPEASIKLIEPDVHLPDATPAW
jgi:HAD superfamily hydrolase (TIGR01549 family)